VWALDNETAYAAERNWMRDLRGVHIWIVAVQATFDFAEDGRLALADEQPPPPLAPEHRGDPAKTSLRRDSELLAVKPGTDVLVDGHAHAPGGRPAQTVPVVLRVGGMLNKRLLVHGTRAFYQGLLGLRTSKPIPFTSRPIVYESAYGGADVSDPDPKRQRIDLRNPVGKGVAARPEKLVNTEAYAVEYLDGAPEKRGPAGFGPIAPSWSPRLELAGTYDESWARTKKPLLPDDYDERFGLSAPADQRPPKPLRGGEQLELVNLTASGLLRLALPKIYFAFTTAFGRRREEHRANISTVFVLPELRRLQVVWQTSLRVKAPDVEHLDATTIREKELLT
jgi:hypothetical protein